MRPNIVAGWPHQRGIYINSLLCVTSTSPTPFVSIVLNVGVGAWHGDARHMCGKAPESRSSHERSGSSLGQKMTQEIEMQEPAIGGCALSTILLRPYAHLSPISSLWPPTTQERWRDGIPCKDWKRLPAAPPPSSTCVPIVSRTPKPPCLPCRETDGRASQLLGLSSFAYSFAYLILNPDPVYVIHLPQKPRRDVH